MKNIWTKYSMGHGWEWVLIILALFATIVFIIMHNWFAMVWAIFASLSQIYAWRLRLELEKERLLNNKRI